MNEADILCWAAGAAVRLPDFRGVNDERILYLLGIDEDWLVELVGQHALAQRFARRYQREQPSWCTRRVAWRVARLCAATEARIRRQIAAFRELLAASPVGRSPLPIKGFTTYALTGSPNCLRFSEDLDLVSDDPEALLTPLRRLGYTFEPTGSHEWGTARRGEVVIEIHNYFPVWKYPPSIAASDLRADRHPGTWRQPSGYVTERPIRHEHLLGSAIAGVTPDTGDFVIPGPAMAVLILCAHQFRNFVEPVRRRLGTKLVELAEILELTRHPRFRKGDFLQLVEEFGAEDSIALVEALFQIYFGRSPLPKVRSAVRNHPIPHMPRVVTGIGGWCASGLSAANLLQPCSARASIERLNVNPIAATSNFRIRHRVLTLGSGPWLEHLIVQSATDAQLSFQLAAAWSGDEIGFEVTLPPLLNGKEEQYTLRVFQDVRDAAGSLNIADNGRSLSEHFGLGRSNVGRAGEGGYHAEMWLPRDRFLPTRPRSGPLPLLLCVARYRHDAHAPQGAEFDPVVIAPLLVTRS